MVTFLVTNCHSYEEHHFSMDCICLDPTCATNLLLDAINDINMSGLKIIAFHFSMLSINLVLNIDWFLGLQIHRESKALSIDNYANVKGISLSFWTMNKCSLAQKLCK